MRKLVFNVLPIEQPIGVFYLSKVKATDLVGAVDIVSRKYSEEGVQRELIEQRVKDISNYCEDPDATFPTPIIISVNNEIQVEFDEENSRITIFFDQPFGEVIDGQHRLKGIFNSSRIEQFELPIILMFDLTLEEKAYVFSTINSNQKKVDKSLIYDLFGVSTGRSPQRTAHEIARAMNTMEISPFFNRLKMLGKKTPDQPDATISQGTFSKRVVSLISKNENLDLLKCKKGLALEQDESLSFRRFFIEGKDEVILKILLNCFSALREVFYEEWKSPHEFILWKTTGFNAVIDSLKEIVPLGIKQKNLTQAFFTDVFKQFKTTLEKLNLRLKSRVFGSGESETSKLKNLILYSIGLEGDWVIEEYIKKQ